MNLKDLEGKEIVIYGAGHVGQKFYRTLRMYGMEKQVICFAVTGQAGEEAWAEGVPVKCIHDIFIGSNTLVCLAVHETLRDEMAGIVRQITGQYIWIYPYLYDLMFGKPESINREIRISEILKTCGNDARLAVRLAAVEQYNGKNSYGYDYYIRAQMMHCTEYTAEQRLEQFKRLMADWEKHGYQREYPLSLNRGYEVIDGNHRLSLAAYHRLDTILCNIYPTQIPLVDIHGQEPVMPESVLIQHGFTQEDMERLDKLQRKYIDIYGE